MTVDELIQSLENVPKEMRVLVCGKELYEMIIQMGSFKAYPLEMTICCVPSGEHVLVVHLGSPDENPEEG